ncbi:MAG: hypothetical protein HUJ56_08545 [Erysipelotrichaceae bacterium]|nr:hypothetical protein [Erysipelotrichaceae bacterium]
MTTEEFSNEFDTLLNSYNKKPEIGSAYNTVELDEYEKSVFLTKAQEGLIIDLYNGKNPFRDSFEKTEEIRRYLSELVKTYTTTEQILGLTGLSSNSVFFTLPENLWFITYEAGVIDDEKAGCHNGDTVSIVPTTQDDYYRLIRNPFRGANERRALRLDITNKTVEIIPEYNIGKYLVRYLAKPDPIIVSTLPENLSINNIRVKTECKLNPALHREILERAVKMSLISKGIKFENN